MTSVINSGWAAFSVLLMLSGAVVAAWAIRRAVIDLRHTPRDPARAFVLLRGFRHAMIGLCVMALGIGWYWHLPAVVGLALIIGFEETLESSTMIAALKSDPRTEPRRGVPRRGIHPMSSASRSS